MGLRKRLSDVFRNDVPSTVPWPAVELFHWKPTDGSLNFGDELSTVVVAKILANHRRFIGEGTRRSARLLAIGSILHFAMDGDTVWGSGVNGKIPAECHKFRNLNIRAVRGPKTAEFLLEMGLNVPAIYGDPALLLPHLLGDRFVRNVNRRRVFVPNLHDMTLVKGWSDVVSPMNAWNICVEEILSSELVLASSLHGLIIAEAYGIPARYVRLSEEENTFKYEDYVRGTGRPGLEYAKSLDEAIEMGGMSPIIFDPKQLLGAFPIDLWN